MGEQSSQTKNKTTNQQSVLDMSKLPTSGDTSSSRALPTIRGVSTLLNCLFELEKQLDRVPLEKGKVGDSVSNVLPGDWLPATLNAIGLHFTEVRVNEYRCNICSLLSVCNSCILYTTYTYMYLERAYIQPHHKLIMLQVLRVYLYIIID